MKYDLKIAKMKQIAKRTPFKASEAKPLVSPLWTLDDLFFAALQGILKTLDFLFFRRAERKAYCPIYHIPNLWQPIYVRQVMKNKSLDFKFFKAQKLYFWTCLYSKLGNADVFVNIDDKSFKRTVFCVIFCRKIYFWQDFATQKQQNTKFSLRSITVNYGQHTSVNYGFLKSVSCLSSTDCIVNHVDTCCECSLTRTSWL